MPQDPEMLVYIMAKHKKTQQAAAAAGAAATAVIARLLAVPAWPVLL